MDIEEPKGKLAGHVVTAPQSPVPKTRFMKFFRRGIEEKNLSFSDDRATEFLKYRIKKIGKAPGSLVHFGRVETGSVKISIVEYGPEFYLERDNVSIKECLETPLKQNVTWINISGIHDTKLIEKLGERFHLHSLMLEDIVNATQRSKLDVYPDNLFFFLKLIFYQTDNNGFIDEQVSFVLGDKYLITFLEEEKDTFHHVRERLRADKSHMRLLGADYLCYALLDTLVDQYFLVLEKVDEKIETLEKELLNYTGPKTLFKIQKLKQDILLLKKSIWPIREVINGFRHVENSFVTPTTKLFLNDVYDHSIQLMETVDSFREITGGLLEIYISSINYRMNEVMKFLTVVATIFVPLTFIASVYGMNFKYMPELEWVWGYYFTLGIMGIVALVMIAYFRYKKWF